MSGIEFIDDTQSYSPNDAFVAHIPIVNNKDELLKQLHDKLNLPNYFGSNWDALDESLRDFEWIQQLKITLIHDDMPALPDAELETYLDILNRAIKDWQDFKSQPDRSDWQEHILEVVFPESGKKIIRKYLHVSD